MLVQQEGNRNVKRNIEHYNLDMIIALGYRVQSDVAVRFRIWATKRLHEYIQKGFAIDDERLKQGGNRYFKELPYPFINYEGDFLIIKQLKHMIVKVMGHM